MQDEAAEIVTRLDSFVSELDRMGTTQDFSVATLSKKSWKEADQSQIDVGLATMVIYPAISPPRSTYDELVSSGRFGAISNTTVRKSISEYYADLDFVESQLLFFRQISEESMRVAGDGLLMIYDPDTELRLKTAFDLKALANNDQYMSKLVRELRNQRMFQKYRRMLLGSAVEMCQALANITDEPCPAVKMSDTN